MPVFDLAVWLAILLSVASAALCVVYGLLHWNVDDGPAHPPIRESRVPPAGTDPVEPERSPG